MSISDITPQAWFSYLDFRIGCDISPSTLNIELKTIKGFLFFAQNFGMPICNSFFKIRLLHVETKFPKDVPDDELCILFLELEQEALSTNPKHQRLGLMDRAWFLLMLHSGLRSGEVRRLCLDDLDFQSRTIRINQSKGNKDRIVYFSQMVSDALTAFLEVRCSMRGLPDNVFIFRGKSLSQSYFGQRLRIYATRCDVLITPHQLRHTCATWLLNERVSIASVQKILGHQRVDITMRYARLYDATVAEDYSKAMKRIEGNPPS